MSGGVRTMVKWITVLVVEPGKAPEVRELPNNLKAFELTIKGFIEMVETVRPGCLIIFDGNINHPKKPVNRSEIQGTFIIARVDPPELGTLNEKDIEILSEVYK